MLELIIHSFCVHTQRYTSPQGYNNRVVLHKLQIHRSYTNNNGSPLWLRIVFGPPNCRTNKFWKTPTSNKLVLQHRWRTERMLSPEGLNFGRLIALYWSNTLRFYVAGWWWNLYVPPCSIFPKDWQTAGGYYSTNRIQILEWLLDSWDPSSVLYLYSVHFAHCKTCV